LAIDLATAVDERPSGASARDPALGGRGMAHRGQRVELDQVPTFMGAYADRPGAGQGQGADRGHHELPPNHHVVTSKTPRAGFGAGYRAWLPHARRPNTELSST